MKKLLILLSVLTISGTAIPTTIAASPYQKQKTINNSDINYQETSNLSIKKENNYKQINEKIITTTLTIDNDYNKCFKNLIKIIEELYNENILLCLRGQISRDRPVSCGVDENGNLLNHYFINQDNTRLDYFVITVNIKGSKDVSDRNIQLIFRSSDLYLQGFIGHPDNKNVYYFFKDATIRELNLRFNINHSIIMNFD